MKRVQPLRSLFIIYEIHFLGAIYLSDLDRRMAALGVRYIRYMDDILIFAPTRWKLRRAIRVMNRTFAELGLEQHPDKTFIGRTARGFDFPGYHFAVGGVTLAEQTIRRMQQKALRLYEQESLNTPQKRVQRLGANLQRWRHWAAINPTRRHNNLVYRYMALFVPRGNQH